MKRVWLSIGSCFLVSVMLVAGLFLMANQTKENRSSFLREFPPHPVLEGDSINIEYDSYYIAGGTRHTLYLANRLSPLRMIVLKTATLDTQHIQLDIPGIFEQKVRSVQVQVDSPFYYLSDGSIPVLYKGKVHNWHAGKISNLRTFFRSIVPLSSSSFAVKSLSKKTGENILGKIHERDSSRYFTDQILQKQIDGIFCTDGAMRFNNDLKQLIYLYSYRNEIIVLDTMLQVLHRWHTIDTTSRANVQSAVIQSERARVLLTPPLLINKQIDTQGRWLFVNSGLRARNEHPKAFSNGDVIDVYDLQNGTYVFSFYLHKFRKLKSMSEFRVFRDVMIVRFENVIRVYKLVPAYFKEKG